MSVKKLNKKGFSLVELLTTIAILGILISVAVGAVTIYLNRTREQAMGTIASSSYDGMVNYMMEKNILLNPKGEPNSSTTIDIETLFEEQYIEKPIDPYNKGTTCKGTVTVTNETSSATVGLADYRYQVEVRCSGGHKIEKQYP